MTTIVHKATNVVKRDGQLDSWSTPRNEQRRAEYEWRKPRIEARVVPDAEEVSDMQKRIKRILGISA